MTDGSLERLQIHLQALVGERHPASSPQALKQAEQYLSQQFGLLHLQVSLHPFDASGITYYNVVAVRPSTSTSGEGPPVLVTAHYDTVLGSPGADDNASGLAVLLEVARSLRDVPLRREVRFIGFCLEEADLLGSLAYVARLKAGHHAIRGAIVLECVGYCSAEEGSQLVPPGLPIPVPSTGHFLGIVGNVASADLATDVERAANRAVRNLSTVSLLVPGQGEQFPDTRRSDHAAFWAYGYPAVMLTDTANFRNPHYHQPTDTLDTLDLAFMEQVAAAVTAAAIRLAGSE